jgi:AcrR family transcriptional regulator
MRGLDRDGIEAVSMRKVAQKLGVETMSLYTHVRGKDDLLDGMADRIVGMVTVARVEGDWKAGLRAMILGARAVLITHAWAPRVIETRAEAGQATLRYMDAVAATLLGGGFSADLAHHALHVLDSRVLGFTQNLYDDRGTVDPEAATAMAREIGAAYPFVGAIALAASHEGGLGGCDDDVEFVFGLDLILDGLEARRGS